MATKRTKRPQTSVPTQGVEGSGAPRAITEARLRRAAEVISAAIEAGREPYLRGRYESGFVDRAKGIDAPLAVLAQQYFLGQVPPSERAFVRGGLMHVLAAETRPSFGAALPVAAIVLPSDPWQFIDEVLAWVHRIAQVGQLAPVPHGIGIAAGIALYYFVYPPNPTGCTVGADTLDKWRHCYVGCKIQFWAPGGVALSALFAALKELADLMGLGTPDWEDLIETLRGGLTCGFFESCDDCCCRHGY